MPLIDAHLHYVNFIQQSEGMDALIKKMDEGKITKAVLMGLPLLKKWDSFEKIEPHRYLDNDSKCYYYSYTDQIITNAFLSLDEITKKRFAPLLCGFNPTDLHNIKHVEYLLNNDSHWRGVGEIFLRHNSLTNITNEETARANHPAMNRIYQLCIEKNLPIVVHQDSTATDRPDIYEYTEELQDVLKCFPNLKLVWAHGGVSENIKYQYYYKMIRTLLNSFHHLYIDLSWVIFDKIICKNGIIAKNWITTIEQYPHRFIIGSDLIGNFTELPRALKKYNMLLTKLSPTTKNLVSYENANNLFFK